MCKIARSQTQGHEIDGLSSSNTFSITVAISLQTDQSVYNYCMRPFFGWWANIIGIQIEEGIENIVEDMVDNGFTVLESTLCASRTCTSQRTIQRKIPSI